MPLTDPGSDGARDQRHRGQRGVAAAALTGAVLCGGASLRMGESKATLELAGQPMAIWVAEAIAGAGIEPVVALGGTPPPGLRLLADDTPGSGPLAALIGALSEFGDLFVAPCDVPTLSTATVSELLHVAVGNPDADAVLAHSDRTEPLIGIYRLSALDVLCSAASEGAKGPKWALGSLTVATVSVASEAVRNVNEPADAEAVAISLEQRTSPKHQFQRADW